MDSKDLICIGCPLGCSVHVTMDEGKVINVSGHTCKRGEVYARKEVTNPTRIVTSTVRVSGSDVRTVSVKTETDIPKGKIFECMQALKGICVSAPVHIGDIVVENVAHTGVNVIATKNIFRKS